MLPGATVGKRRPISLAQAAGSGLLIIRVDEFVRHDEYVRAHGLPRVPAEFQDYVAYGALAFGSSYAEESQKKKPNETSKPTSCDVYRMDYDDDEDEAGEQDYFDEESMNTAFVARDKTGRIVLTVEERLLEEQRDDEARQWKR